MLFSLLRIIICIFASAVIIFILKKKNIKNKALPILIIILCFILVTLSGMFPIENLFVKFKTPEKVFNYTHKGEIHDIAYGENSCLIMYKDQHNSISHYIIPKIENGYQIPKYFAVKNVSSKFDKDGKFDIYNIKGTQDFYVVGTVLSNSSEHSIVDSLGNSVQYIVIDMEDSNTKILIIYSCVHDFNSDYYFYINGVKTEVAD